MKKRRFFIISFCAAVLLLAIVVAILRPKGQVLYRVTYLPSLGGNFTLPYSINDKGQIAGFSEVSKGSYHLFVWDREKGIQDLGPVVNNPVCINNAGQIAATMQDPSGHQSAFIWDPDHGRYLLPTLGGKITSAQGINNHGQVVGYAETASGTYQACVWNAALEILDLTPSARNTHASSINDAGQVIVFIQGTAPRLVDMNDGLTSISPSIPFHGLAEINSKGFVAGIVRTGRVKLDVVIWHQDLGQKKLIQSYANSSSYTKINDVNQVLLTRGRQPKFRLFGRTLFSTRARNYLHDQRRGWLSLNEYISVGPHEDLCLTDLNNKGCIIGAMQSTKGSRSRGVLLEPISERWEK